MRDNETVTYSHRGTKSGIYARNADGRSAASQFLPLDAIHWLIGWTPDRRTFAYGVMEGTPSSIMALRDSQSRRVIGPAGTWADDCRGTAGGWCMACSRPGRRRVRHSLPRGWHRWLIAQGTDPAWAPDDSEIYYRSANRLMAARIDKTAGVRVFRTGS